VCALSACVVAKLGVGAFAVEPTTARPAHRLAHVALAPTGLACIEEKREALAASPSTSRSSWLHRSMAQAGVGGRAGDAAPCRSGLTSG
jgi:hypothetical protein